MKALDFIKEFSDKDFFCVYRLINDEGVVIYVGSSSYPSSRIKSHLYSDKDFSEVDFIKMKNHRSMIDMEAKNIILHNPKFNSTIPCNGHAVLLSFALERLSQTIKIHASELPTVFSRVRSSYVSMHDLNTLITDIEQAAIKSISAINKLHKKECE